MDITRTACSAGCGINLPAATAAALQRTWKPEMKRLILATLVGTITALLQGTAWADVIDFEHLDTTHAPNAPLLATGDYVTQGEFFVNTQTTDGAFGLLGQLSNGADPGSCYSNVCPTGNSTNFLNVFNDGILHVGDIYGSAVAFSGAAFSFLLAPDDPAGDVPMYMAIEADRSDGSHAVYAYALGNSTSFTTINLQSTGRLIDGTGTLTSGNVTDIYFYGYYCSQTTDTCLPFNSNKAQFAVDNISISAVPEPSVGVLLAAGLSLVGFYARRSRTKSQYQL